MKENCDICQHKVICKWVPDMESVEREVNNISFGTMSPVLVIIKCNKFQKKNLKQDGFFNQR